MRQKLFLSLFFAATLVAVTGQTHVIKGHVTDQDKRSVDRATVNAGGTKVTVITNTEGAFSITVPSTANTLVISSVGYSPVERPIDSDNINVVLTKRDKSLDEVVVVGYGQSQK